MNVSRACVQWKREREREREGERERERERERGIRNTVQRKKKGSKINLVEIVHLRHNADSNKKKESPSARFVNLRISSQREFHGDTEGLGGRNELAHTHTHITTKWQRQATH